MQNGALLYPLTRPLLQAHPNTHPAITNYQLAIFAATMTLTSGKPPFIL